MKIHFGLTAFDKYSLGRDFDEMKEQYKELLRINPKNKWNELELEPIKKEKRD